MRTNLQRLALIFLLFYACLLINGSTAASQARTTPLNRAFMITDAGLVALDQNTGRQLWSFQPPAWQGPKDPRIGNFLVDNGVAYWLVGDLYAFSITSGKQLWRTVLDLKNSTGRMSVRHAKIYLHFLATIEAFDEQSGKLLWKTDVESDRTASSGNWLFTFGNEAIYMWKDLTLLSLDDETGTIQWRNKQVAACDQQLDWIYPAGDILLLSLEKFGASGGSQVRGLQASDGRSLWQLSINQGVLWTTPGQDTFYIVDNSRLTYKGVLVPVSITAYGIQGAQKSWQREEQASYLTVSRGMFYLIDGPDSKNITALNGSDGSVSWSTRSDRTYTSLDIDDGTLYATNSRGEVGVFSADDGREQWSYQNKNPNVSFVVANHNLYMRELSNGHLTGTLIALDANGTGPLWSWQAGSDASGPLGNGYYLFLSISRLSCPTP